MNNGKKHHKPKAHGGVRVKRGGIGTQCHRQLGPKIQWDTLCNYDLYFGVAVSQFRVDRQSVHFWVLVSRGWNVFGSSPSVFAMFGMSLYISSPNVGGHNIQQVP